MLAYAANRPLAGSRRSSPNTLLFIIGGHVALIAAVMSAKMDLPQRIYPAPPLIHVDPDPLPPPPNDIGKPRSERPHSREISIDHKAALLPATRPGNPPDDGTPLNPGSLTGATVVVAPVLPETRTAPVHLLPRLLTRPEDLKPPYPSSKILSEEEAVLMLRLSIDDHGRVVAVEPIGKADRDFLDAARRHLLAHWRYQPAMDDGRAVASSLVITLRFQLDG